MVRIHEQFFNKDKALRFRKEILSKYPETTYGTRLTGPRTSRLEPNIWTISGSRFA